MVRTLLAAAALSCAGGCSDPTVDGPGLADAGDGGAHLDGGAVAIEAAGSVLQYHRDGAHGGLYLDATLTRTSVAGLHRDPAFHATIDGAAYAQPLFIASGGGGRDLVVVATESSEVSALDARTGAPRWRRVLDPPTPRADLPCGNIDPVGVTGTPVVDAASGTLYVDTLARGGEDLPTAHRVHALSLLDGSERPGWPADLAAVAGFDARVQNQRGALALLDGVVYVPFGGHAGDCGAYRGRVVGFPVGDPARPRAFATRAEAAGIWSPGGIVTDGASLFVATGNGRGAAEWSDAEAILRLGPGATFSCAAPDYFAPANWRDLDDADADLGGTAPVLVHVDGATPADLVVALGKDGKAYLLDRARLGGIGGAVAVAQVATDAIINGAATYVTPSGTYVVFKGHGVGCASGDLTAVRLAPGAPPTVKVAWCADQGGSGSPIAVRGGDGGVVVLGVGAEGGGRLRAFDGDTGAVRFGGGGDAERMPSLARFITPIVAGHRVYVAGVGEVHAFTW